MARYYNLRTGQVSDSQVNPGPEWLSIDLGGMNLTLSQVPGGGALWNTIQPIPGSNNLHIDAQGNIYRQAPNSDPEGDSSLVRTGQRDPALAQRVFGQVAGTQVRQAQQAADYNQQATQRYNAYQTAANGGVTGQALQAAAGVATPTPARIQPAGGYSTLSNPPLMRPTIPLGTGQVTPAATASPTMRPTIPTGAGQVTSTAGEAITPDNAMNYSSAELAQLPNEVLEPIIGKLVTERGSGILLDFTPERLAQFSIPSINAFLRALDNNPDPRVQAVVSHLSNAVREAGGTPYQTKVPVAPAPTTPAGQTTTPGQTGQTPPPASTTVDYGKLARVRKDVLNLYRQQPEWKDKSDQEIFDHWWANTASPAERAAGSLAAFANGLPDAPGGNTPTNPNNPSAPGATPTNPAGGTGAGAPPTAPASGGNGSPVRPLDQILTPGGTPDFAQMNEQERRYYLPFGQNPDLAARNVARARGFNVDVGNPLAESVAGTISPLARIIGQSLSLQGQSANEGDIAQAVSNNLGAGRATLFDPNQSETFLMQAADLIDRRNRGEKLDPGQLALAQQLTEDPKAAWTLITDANASKLSPLFRDNASLLNRAFGSAYEQYYNAGAGAAKNKSFLNYYLTRPAAA